MYVCKDLIVQAATVRLLEQQEHDKATTLCFTTSSSNSFFLVQCATVNIDGQLDSTYTDCSPHHLRRLQSHIPHPFLSPMNLLQMLSLFSIVPE